MKAVITNMGKKAYTESRTVSGQAFDGTEPTMDMLYNWSQEWIRRIGLADWNIVVTLSDNALQAAVDGESNYSYSTKTAEIRIASLKAFKEAGCADGCYDAERTLVHELLHLKFSLLDETEGCDCETLRERVLHQLIDDIARALVAVKRESRMAESVCSLEDAENGAGETEGPLSGITVSPGWVKTNKRAGKNEASTDVA